MEGAGKQGALSGSAGLQLQVNTLSPSTEGLETFYNLHQGKSELQVWKPAWGGLQCTEALLLP